MAAHTGVGAMRVLCGWAPHPQPTHLALRGIPRPIRFIPRCIALPAPTAENLRIWDTLTCEGEQ